MKLALISDYDFVKSGTSWYAKIPWDRRFIETFGGAVDHIVLVGRCRQVQPGDKIDRWYPVDSTCYTVVTMPYWDGFGFVRHFPSIIRNLHRVLRECDGVFLKMFYVQSVVAHFINRYFVRKPSAALLVGDAPVAFLKRDDLVSAGRLRALTSRFVAFLTKRLLAQVDLAATVSRHLRETYTSRSDVVVANESWVDEEHFHYRQQDAPTGAILYVARLVPLKGINEFVDALHLLDQRGVDFRCTIVGEGYLRSEIERKIATLGLSNRVTVAGWLRSLSPELLELYRRSDVLCLPSYSEGLPLVLLEAMANGVAVVASRVGGVPELVCHEHNGLLIEPGDIEGIASSLKRMLTDHDLWRRCVANGYQSAQENTYRLQRKKLGQAVAKKLWGEKPA